MTRPARILIADDQPDVAEALRLLFKSEGWLVEVVSSPQAALAAISHGEFDLLVADLNYTRDTTCGREGLDLLARVPAIDPTLPVVVMTAWATVEVAVEAMRRGARDFIQKPWENARAIVTFVAQRWSTHWHFSLPHSCSPRRHGSPVRSQPAVPRVSVRS